MSNVNENIRENLIPETNQILDIAVEYSPEQNINFEGWNELKEEINSLLNDRTTVNNENIFEEVGEDRLDSDNISISESDIENNKDRILETENLLEDIIIEDRLGIENQNSMIDELAIKEEFFFESHLDKEDGIFEEVDSAIETESAVQHESVDKNVVISEDEFSEIESYIFEESEKGESPEMYNQTFFGNPFAPEYIQKLREEIQAEIAANIPIRKAEDNVDFFREAEELLGSVNPSGALEKQNAQKIEALTEVEAPYEFDFTW